MLSQPSGSGQTNLWMPQGVLGQVMIGGDQGYVVRWEHSYSSWTLFTCEVEMLLHVVSTAGTPPCVHIFSPADKIQKSVKIQCFLLLPTNQPSFLVPDVIAHCARVKPILDLVHKIISTDWTVSDCLLPLTSRIYMLLQRYARFTETLITLLKRDGYVLLPVRNRLDPDLICLVMCVFTPVRLTSVINPPVDVIASCVNCLSVLAARMPGKVGMLGTASVNTGVKLRI